MSGTYTSHKIIDTSNAKAGNDKPVVTKSHSYSYSKSTKTTTTTATKTSRDGLQPNTVTETVTEESTSSNQPPTYDDGFEELKRSILSGEAYKQKIEELKAQAGFPRYRPDEGSTLIRPVRVESSSSSPKDSNINSGSQQTTPKMSSHYRTELHIPVRRYHDTFDDFFMNRWHENNSSAMDTEFSKRRVDWESRLDDLKQGFFHFSPFTEASSHRAVDSSKTIQSPVSYRDRCHSGGKRSSHCSNQTKYSTKTTTTTTTTTRNFQKKFPIALSECNGRTPSIELSPAGKPEFAIQFDVKDFKPEEVNVSTKEGKLLITAHHEEKHGNTTSKKEFKRTVDLPKDIQIGLMKSILSKDGILNVTAPIKPPNYEPAALTSSSQVTQQHATALNTAASSHLATREANSKSALNYSIPVIGYNPEEVSVTVEGRKVKVHAKHDEIARGKKTHNEMTKTFDLPPGVEPYQVRSYIKDGATLYIEGHLRDDLMGRIHVVPVWHK